MRDNDVTSKESFTWELPESGPVGKEEGQGGFKKASNQQQPQRGLPDSHSELLKGEALITWNRKRYEIHQ